MAKIGINSLAPVMTLAELVRETLTEKNRRLRQAKCKHEDTYSQGCNGPSGSFASGFCWECGKSWRHERWNTSDESDGPGAESRAPGRTVENL